MTNDTIIIILAAGRGKRMESDIPKVLHELNNITLIERVINTSKKIINFKKTMFFMINFKIRLK